MLCTVDIEECLEVGCSVGTSLDILILYTSVNMRDEQSRMSSGMSDDGRACPLGFIGNDLFSVPPNVSCIRLNGDLRHLGEDRQDILDEWIKRRSERFSQFLHQRAGLLRDRRSQADNLRSAWYMRVDVQSWTVLQRSQT